MIVLRENGQFGALGGGVADVGACALVVFFDGEVLVRGLGGWYLLRRGDADFYVPLDYGDAFGGRHCGWFVKV